MSRLLFCCALITVLTAAEPELLSEQGGQAADIHHALQALTRGDTAPLAALPAQVFRAPIAIADPADAGLLRRWTLFLPQAVARVPAARQAQVLEGLDTLFLTCAGSDPVARERVAGDFLPAPAAVAALRREADRRFDRGQLGAFLGCVARLRTLGIGDASLQARQTAADILVGLAIDPAPDLPVLGLPPFATLADSAPQNDRRLDEDAGATIRWRRLGVWLAAVDHQDAVLWQRALDRNAELACGPGGAVVREAGSTRFIDESGRIVLVSPIPYEARILGVSGGCAWLAMGSRTWRVAFDGTIRIVDLDAEPLGPPVLRGTRTLWLDAYRLTLREGDQVVNRALHGLPATLGWRLRSDGATVVIHSDDQRQVVLPDTDALSAQAASPEERAFLLAATGRQDAARALLAVTPHAAETARQEQRLHAELALGWDHVAGRWQELTARATAPATQALILFTGLPTSATRLRERVTAHPEVVLPGDGPLTNRPLWWAAAWDHRRIGSAWLAAQHTGGPRGLPTTTPEPVTVRDDTARRQGDGSLIYDKYLYSITRNDGWLEIVSQPCTPPGSIWRWRHRWSALSDLSAPTVTLSARNGQILVTEGDSRLSAFAAVDGSLIARSGISPSASLWSDALAPAPGVMALIGPAGLDRRAWLLNAMEQRTVELPVAARWLLPIAGRAVVVLSDDRALWLPDLTPCPLPDALTRPPRPVVTDAGLVQGGRLYRWSER